MQLKPIVHPGANLKLKSNNFVANDCLKIQETFFFNMNFIPLSRDMSITYFCNVPKPYANTSN